MHPALSIVFFTTASGAGFALLLLVGVAAICAAVTIACTGMIYASLKPIHQWHNHWVVPNYFMLGLMAGFLLLDLIVRFWVVQPIAIPLLTLLVVVAAWWTKEAYWR